MDLSIITVAGITPAEAASIIGVSRVMMWKYSKGAEPTKLSVKRRAEVLVYVLKRLVDKGSLPKVDLAFSKNMHPEKKAKRKEVLDKIAKLVDDRVAPQPTNA